MEISNYLYGILDTVIYSFVGIIMMGIGFLIVNFICPFSVKKEIEDDQNTSLGIIIGALIIGISIIVAAVISTPSSTHPKVASSKKIEAEKKAELKSDVKPAVKSAQ